MITAEEIDAYTPVWTAAWVIQGIPVDAINAYLTMTRNMAIMNTALATWIEMGQPNPGDYPPSANIHVARDAMIHAAQRLRRYEHLPLPDRWAEQIVTVLDEPRIMRGYEPGLHLT